MLHILSSAPVGELVRSYGLWLVFALIMLESMGLPLPGETALISAALFAGATHQIDIAMVVAVAAFAAIIGDNIGFVIGRTIGFRLLLRYGRYVRLTEPRMKIGQYLFLRHGGKIVFFGRFIAILRAFAALLAGANRMRWAKFLLMNALGGICWAGIYGFGAYMFGEIIKQTAGPVGMVLLVVGLLLALGGILFFRRHEKDLAARAEIAFPGPLLVPSGPPWP